MLAKIELPTYPTSIDCLAWSPDGELAIAANDTVHLLIPRRDYGQYPQHAFSLDPWVKISFKVNAFTSTEWPPHDLSDLADLSIGEEQSPSTIVSLSWSPPGLARHRRCILAVLTTNHILSLWTSDSNFTAASTWQRVLIINKALQISPEDESSDGKHVVGFEPSRQSARIRSMSWAPNNVAHSPQSLSLPQSTSPYAACQTQYLAVTNDADGIAILQIQSPWYCGGNKWEAQLTHTNHWKDLVDISKSVQSEAASYSSKNSPRADRAGQWPSFLASCVAKKTFIDQVTCIPPWTPEAVFGLILRKDEQALRFEIFPHVVPGASVAGQWMPLSYSTNTSPYRVRFPSFNCAAAVSTGKVPNSSSHIAVAGNESNVELLLCEAPEKAMDNTQILSSAVAAPRTLSIVDEWDEISGLAFVSVPGALVLQASGLLSGSFAVRIEFDCGGIPGLHAPYPSALHEQASALRKDFDRHRDLGGLSLTKTWGLASWGPYVASCVTMHPGDMIEYSLVSEQRCHILFNQEGIISNGLEEDAIFPWQDPSRATNQQSGSAVLDKILLVLDGMAVPHGAAGTKILYNLCCAAMICPDMQEWHVVERILRDLSVLSGTSYGSETSLLHSIKASQMSMLERAEKLNELVSARIEQEDSFIPDQLYDLCSICDQLIVWQDLNEAYCISHHQFARCGITLLPILEPGISKSCETCHREFLNEATLVQIVSEDDTDLAEHIAADDTGVRRLSSSVSLLKDLYDQFDICPYCHGKYIG